MPKYVSGFMTNFFEKTFIKFKYLAKIVNFLINNKKV